MIIIKDIFLEPVLELPTASIEHSSSYSEPSKELADNFAGPDLISNLSQIFEKRDRSYTMANRARIDSMISALTL
jgi:hypothetical protein